MAMRAFMTYSVHMSSFLCSRFIVCMCMRCCSTCVCMWHVRVNGYTLKQDEVVREYIHSLCPCVCQPSLVSWIPATVTDYYYFF